MNQESIVLITMMVVFTVLGVMLILGKADFVIKRHLRDPQRYNIQRMRIVHAVALFVVDIMLILFLCGVDECIAVFAPMPIVVIIAILQYTWARKK